MSSRPSLQLFATPCYRMDINFYRVHLCNQWHKPILAGKLISVEIARVHLCNQMLFCACRAAWRQGASFVANTLKNPILCSFIRVVLTVLFPVVTIIPAPFLLADPLALTILCLMTKLIPLPGCLSRFLAFLHAAVILTLIAGKKKCPAVKTGYFFHLSYLLAKFNRRSKTTEENVVG